LPEYAHAAEIARLADSKEIADLIGSMGEFPNPYSEGDAIEMIGSSLSAYELGIGYNFEVVPRAEGNIAGMVGIRNVNANTLSGEIGFWIGESYQGKGYAKSALKLLIAFGLKKLGLNRIYATALARNSKSIALMESLGMEKEGVLRMSAMTKKGPEDTVMLAVLKGDFKIDFDMEITE